MSAAASPSGGVILEQLQSDVPQSPLISHLRSRLSLGEEDAASPSSRRTDGTGSIQNRGPAWANSLRDSMASTGNETQNSLSASPGEDEEWDGTRVDDAQFHAPISADHMNPPSSAEMGDPDAAETAGGDGVEAQSRTGSGFGDGYVSRPESYVVVHNVAKRHNLGTIARSAVAFGVSEIIVVGRKDFNAFGSHGSSQHMQFRHFHTLSECALYLQAKDVDICGVEIVNGAKAVHRHPFRRSTAFVLGNEGTGLSKKEMDICSSFVYIPQCGSGTASLNVTVAASIVLHHFSVWAGFTEGERAGQKFVVGQRPVRRTRRNVVEDPDAMKERRAQKADGGTDDWLLCDTDENEAIETPCNADICTVEFPRDRPSRLLSSLSKLYS